MSIRTQVIDKLNQLGRTRVRLELSRNAAIQKAKNAKAAIDERLSTQLSGIEAKIEAIDPKIGVTIADHRSALVAEGKQSFTTSEWKFQFRKVPGKMQVTDADAIMGIARRLGIVRKIADPPTQEWRFSLKKFLEMLEENPEYNSYFDDYIDQPDETETLHMSPNSGHTVYHDSKRVSPPSIRIKS